MSGRLFYFSPVGRRISQEEHHALLAGDPEQMRREILSVATNAKLCDLAVRAGLPFEYPYRFALGQLNLTGEQLSRLQAAFFDPHFIALKNMHSPETIETYRSKQLETHQPTNNTISPISQPATDGSNYKPYFID